MGWRLVLGWELETVAERDSHALEGFLPPEDRRVLISGSFRRVTSIMSAILG